MGLRQNILTDPVSELDVRQAVTVKQDTTARQAIALMRQHQLGCVIVVDGHGRAVGKFTERLVIRMLLEDPSKLDQPMRNLKIHAADPIRDTDSIASMISKMQVGNLRFLCVVDAHNKPVALSGQKGLMEYIAEHFPRQIKVQRMRSKIFLDEREGA